MLITPEYDNVGLDPSRMHCRDGVQSSVRLVRIQFASELIHSIDGSGFVDEFSYIGNSDPFPYTAADEAYTTGTGPPGRRDRLQQPHRRGLADPMTSSTALH